jgi:hypothetical protein
LPPGPIRLTFVRIVVALTALIVLANLAFVALSIHAWFANNDMPDQIAAYSMRGVTAEEAAMADYLTRDVCPAHADDPACAGTAQDRAALVHHLCETKITDVTHSEFGPPNPAQAEAIASYKYCQFAPPELGGWLDEARPGLIAEAWAVALIYAELLGVSLLWRRWARTPERAALLASLAASLAAYVLVSDQYSIAMHAIAAIAVLGLAIVLIAFARRLAR